jgi:type IV secretory pathway VirB4 component
MSIYQELLPKRRWRARHLSDVMPWRAVAAPGVILHKQTHALQRSYLMRGPDLSSEVQETQGALMLQANNVFKRLGGAWTVHCEAQRLPVTTYPESQLPTPVAALIDEERRRAVVEDPGSFETRYYLTLTWQPPSPAKSAWARLFVAGLPEAPGQAAGLREFITQADYLVYLLRGMLAVARPLTTDETLTYLHSCVSDRWHAVRFPELPVDVDVMVCDTPFHGGWYPQLGKSQLRICSIHGYPPKSVANALQAIDHLRFPYRWSTRWMAYERQSQDYLLARIQKQWVGQEKGALTRLGELMSRRDARVINTSATMKAEDTDAARQEVGADVVAFGDFTATVTVWDEEPERAEAKIRDVMQILDSRGFVTILEKEHATAAWLSSMPGNRHDSVRRTPHHSLTFAHLAPGLAAAWTGAERDDHLKGPPWFFAHTEGATLLRVVNHVLDVGHTLVLGPTGSGKSTLLGLMVAQWLKYPGAQVFIFDVGRSSRCLTLCLGGHYYDLGSERLGFQPLARIDEPGEQRWAHEWLIDLMREVHVPVTGSLQAYLQRGLAVLAREPVHRRTLSELVVVLTALSRQAEVAASKRQDWQERLQAEQMAIRQALMPLTREGEHGNLLDADHDDVHAGYLHTFEQETLLALKRLVGPVTRYLFHRVQERFSTDRPTFLPMDEAALTWIVPAEEPHEAAPAAAMSDYGQQGKEWMMTTRKRGVSLGFFTHSISQVFASALGPLLMESCPTWFMLPNPAARSPQLAEIYHRMGFNPREIELISIARPQRDVYYRAELLGKRLCSLPLSPLELAVLARNTEADHDLMDKILAEHGRAGFAAAWLRAQGFPEAADRVAARREEGHDVAAD